MCTGGAVGKDCYHCDQREETKWNLPLSRATNHVAEMVQKKVGNKDETIMRLNRGQVSKGDYGGRKHYRIK